MENASKALLIAGAILLCILIIAIGMFIYNSAQGTIVSSMNSLSTQEVEAFYREGIGKQKSEEGWYTWTDGKKAYLVDEDKKYLKELSIEDDIQLLVTSTRLISLYPTISNNIFERFFGKRFRNYLG